MKMKQFTLAIALSFSILAVIVLMKSPQAGMVHAQTTGAPVNKPFQAELVMYTYENDPAGRLFFRRVIARNSAGQTAKIEYHGPGLILANRTIDAGGVKVNLDDSTKLKTTLSGTGSSGSPQQVSQTSGACGASVRDEVVAGTSTNIVVMDGGLYKMTEWRAPELGCAVLAYRVEKKDANGKYALLTSTRLVNLIMQEPDPRLFADSGYTEVPPSEYELKGLHQAGMPDSLVSDELRHRLARLDAAYASGRRAQ